jgi:hypothetical protein
MKMGPHRGSRHVQHVGNLGTWHLLEVKQHDCRPLHLVEPAQPVPPLVRTGHLISPRRRILLGSSLFNQPKPDYPLAPPATQVIDRQVRGDLQNPVSKASFHVVQSQPFECPYKRFLRQIICIVFADDDPGYDRIHAGHVPVHQRRITAVVARTNGSDQLDVAAMIIASHQIVPHRCVRLYYSKHDELFQRASSDWKVRIGKGSPTPIYPLLQVDPQPHLALDPA